MDVQGHVRVVPDRRDGRHVGEVGRQAAPHLEVAGRHLEAAEGSDPLVHGRVVVDRDRQLLDRGEDRSREGILRVVDRHPDPTEVGARVEGVSLREGGTVARLQAIGHGALLGVGTHEGEVHVDLVGRADVHGELVRHCTDYVFGLVDHVAVIREAELAFELVGPSDDRVAPRPGVLVLEDVAEEDLDQLGRVGLGDHRSGGLVELHPVGRDREDSGVAIVHCGQELVTGRT